jgi:hypothetical protein
MYVCHVENEGTKECCSTCNLSLLQVEKQTLDIEREKTKSFVEARSKNPKENKECVTLWPCHLH